MNIIRPAVPPGLCPRRCAGFSLPVARSAGFSLVEMLVVLAIAALIVALVVPQISYVQTVELHSSARSLAGTVRLSYATAVTKHNYLRLVMDLEAMNYWVEEKGPEGYAPVKEALLGPQTLAESLYFKRVEVAGQVCEANTGCTAVIYFTPGGFVEEAAIYLATVDEERAVSLFTRSMTGKSAILDGEIPFDQYLEEEYKQ